MKTPCLPDMWGRGVINTIFLVSHSSSHLTVVHTFSLFNPLHVWHSGSLEQMLTMGKCRNLDKNIFFIIDAASIRSCVDANDISLFPFTEFSNIEYRMVSQKKLYVVNNT